MDYFGLRGKQIRVVSASVYENSRWDAALVATINYEVLAIYGVVLATRTREDHHQQPYAYIDQSQDSGRGIWLEGVDFSLSPDPD